ncbi:hypothetical protein A2380_03640 [candidate division WWE3 bacterium RIFOXYB1_FULL_43_24]|uniref:Uncharacterized protein n=2 Tax=Katanobacteria TaxID=422282 RepID=A0A0G0YQ88_UNCKA|nr:MAG: hypothetical protein UU92_C0006G0043 [candidate division WWE3 bacterium GW2011_GWA1_42_12]KKS34394.1 MAG: hypothetical protein UU97_C0011G0030 [candidate division WWE3 bacterium GW2011_GWD1_42_14]KKS38832.1 MAG: hypothetical protein UV00_C0005G0015 [candidate division WWE3 bacterium GW2011_GWF1_42_14]KKS40530.1 MAG: hypothetical protein UV03_C0005G0016 [candidate division WWE3 bacterium GW2011_GWE1_42_16]KKS66961.1 MAG: hypothetical protein UV35_C0005G0042 [candidate division WWE3 bacte
MEIHRKTKERYGSFFEDRIWLAWAEGWFKILEWLTLIALFEYVSVTTGSKILSFIVTISYTLLFYYLYNKLFNTCWFRYRLSKLWSTISSLIITVSAFALVTKIVEQITGKY